jgi:hypothetical protein
MSFIKEYVEHTENQESPAIFHTWVALTMLSAALHRRCWLDRGFTKLYPNVYTILVGPSGRQKKTTAIKIGLKLLEDSKIDVRVYLERMTPEGIMMSLNRVNVQASLITHDSSLLAVAPELTTMVGGDKTQASKMISYLTTWYDCPETFHYITATRGNMEYHNLYISFLAASAEEYLGIIPPDAQAGFLSRVVFVYSKERKRIPQPTMGPHRQHLVDTLQRVAQLNGVFDLEQPAWDFYDDWYKSIPHVNDPRHSGFVERIGDHALKVACLLAAADGVLLVSQAKLVTAISLLERIAPGIQAAMAYIGTTDFAQLTSRVLTLLSINGQLLDQALYNECAYMAGVEDVNKALKDLQTRGLVKVAGVVANHTIYEKI